jgi:hypothetical protein
MSLLRTITPHRYPASSFNPVVIEHLFRLGGRCKPPEAGEVPEDASRLRYSWKNSSMTYIVFGSTWLEG